MTQHKFVLFALAALALGACQQAADDSNIAIDNAVNAAEAAGADVEALPPSESGGAVENEADAAATAGIPARYHGRWGLVPADCTSTRGDNKGLITIADSTMRFYEATATVREQRPAIATAFSALFAFTGEGQAWERVETLTLEGDQLERRSTTPRGDEGDALTYTRCAA